MRIGRFEAILLLGGPVLFLLLFFIAPFLMMMLASLQDKSGALTGAHYLKLATDGYYWSILLETFKMAFWITMVTFVLGYSLAYYLTFHVKSRLLRRLIFIIVVTPLFTSAIVRAFAWIVMLGRQGLVNQVLQTVGIIGAPL